MKMAKRRAGYINKWTKRRGSSVWTFAGRSFCMVLCSSSPRRVILRALARETKIRFDITLHWTNVTFSFTSFTRFVVFRLLFWIFEILWSRSCSPWQSQLSHWLRLLRVDWAFGRGANFGCLLLPSVPNFNFHVAHFFQTSNGPIKLIVVWMFHFLKNLQNHLRTKFHFVKSFFKKASGVLFVSAIAAFIHSLVRWNSHEYEHNHPVLKMFSNFTVLLFTKFRTSGTMFVFKHCSTRRKIDAWNNVCF